MRVVLTDGTEFECANFKALDSGVLLTKDKKRKKVIGFVPVHQLRYVVPDDLEPVETPSAAGEEAVQWGETSNATGAGAAQTHPDADPTITPPAAPSEPVEGAKADVEGGADGGGGELRHIEGLGSTYAERLRVAGYGTLADLAAADPVTVAEAASVAPGRGREWVDAARQAVVAGDATDADGGAGDGDGEDVNADGGDDDADEEGANGDADDTNGDGNGETDDGDVEDDVDDTNGESS
jgi:predicted flap endonuclease-1-like 5' DNA nuclease